MQQADLVVEEKEMHPFHTVFVMSQTIGPGMR